MKIWKYGIPIKDSFNLLMPIGAQILSFQIQNGEPYIWVAVDEHKEYQDRFFQIHGTGNDIDQYNQLKYIGTIQMMDGNLVWHLFEDIT